MTADQVAQKFFESGFNDCLLTKKQTDWLFSFAFHDDIKSSKGTKNMVDFARTAGARVFVYSHKDHQNE